MNKKLLILGCGYSAKFIAQKLISRGWHVFGTTRSKEKFQSFQDLGIEAVFWDDMSALRRVLEQECSVLSSIAPQGSIDNGLRKLQKLVQNESAKVNWLGYLSSTGVYGDRKGGWVQEDSKPDSITSQGKARIMAEGFWQKFSSKNEVPLYLFRVAGIYGPNRNVFEKIKVNAIQKVIKPYQFFNRIHVEDLAGAVCASLYKPKLAGIYNVTDNLPTPGETVIDEASKIMQIPTLPGIKFCDANLSLMAKSFYRESKRVSNKKLSNVLGYSLVYPTYVSGLRSITF